VQFTDSIICFILESTNLPISKYYRLCRTPCSCSANMLYASVTKQPFTTASLVAHSFIILVYSFKLARITNKNTCHCSTLTTHLQEHFILLKSIFLNRYESASTLVKSVFYLHSTKCLKQPPS